jgi:hypothetical protein
LFKQQNFVCVASNYNDNKKGYKEQSMLDGHLHSLFLSWLFMGPLEGNIGHGTINSGSVVGGGVVTWMLHHHFVIYGDCQ